MKWFKIMLAFGLMQQTTACAVHKMNFDCLGGQGVGCQSVSRVNDLVNKDQLKSEIAKHNGQEKKYKSELAKPLLAKPLLCKNCKKEGQVAIVQAMPTSTQLSHNLPVTRAQEKVMRIWFSGFFDEQNNYQTEQYVYSVIEPAKWVSAETPPLVSTRIGGGESSK